MSDVRQQFLADICQHPADDAPRLIFADWLDDHNQGERAEFIRVQIELAGIEKEIERCRTDQAPHAWEFGGPLRGRVPVGQLDALRRRERGLLDAHFAEWTPKLAGEDSGYLLASEPTVRVRLSERYDEDIALTFRRGFIHSVSLPVAAFVGGVCERCAGSGWHEDRSGWPPERDACDACHGSGRTPGHAAALFRAAPIEKVTLDREPWSPGIGENRWWFERDRDDGEPPPPWTLPDELFTLLRDHHPLPAVLNHRRHDNDQAALDALHAAALTWGRRQGWPCPTCQGTGQVAVPLEISTSLGKQTQQVYLGQTTVPAACPDCQGSGHTVCLS